MTITEPHIDKSGANFIFEYSDADNFDDLDKAKCRQVYGVCFCNDKMVIGWGGQKQNWGLVGGKIEIGETFEQLKILRRRQEFNQPCGSCRFLSFCGGCRANAYEQTGLLGGADSNCII